MVDWKEIEIQSGLTTIIDYRGKTPPKSEEGIPLISAANIKNGELDFSKESFISLDDYKEWTKRGFTKPGDVLITTEAPAGEVALLPGDKTYQISRRVMALRADEKTLHNKFLFFALQHPSIKGKLLAASRGSTVPRVLKTDITELKIHIPNYEEQKAISAVLSSLDDKIDLLQRQNKTLEALAQTLFRHWFIDGAEDDWEDGELGDIVEFAYGKGLKKSLRTGEGYPVVGSSGVVDFHSEYLVKAPGIVTGRKGTLGAVLYFSDNFFPIDTTFFIIAKFDSPELYFEYFLLKSINFKDMNTDSAVPGLNRNIALATEVIIPPQSEITRFNNFVHPFFDKIQKNQAQIRTLEKLRDTLLPKLMSGEVRVRHQN